MARTISACKPEKSVNPSASQVSAKRAQSLCVVLLMAGSPDRARGRMPVPTRLLTTACTAFAAYGLLRTRSRARSRRRDSAVPISALGLVPATTQLSVLRPTRAPP